MSWIKLAYGHVWLFDFLFYWALIIKLQSHCDKQRFWLSTLGETWLWVSPYFKASLCRKYSHLASQLHVTTDSVSCICINLGRQTTDAAWNRIKKPQCKQVACSHEAKQRGRLVWRHFPVQTPAANVNRKACSSCCPLKVLAVSNKIEQKRLLLS